jgi:tetratricopeptide (TPR) repeat protein
VGKDKREMRTNYNNDDFDDFDDFDEDDSILLGQLDEVERLVNDNQDDKAKKMLAAIDDEAFEDDPALLVMAASLYQRLNMSDHAYRWIKRIISPEDIAEDPFMADIMAECCSLLGRHEEAVAYYNHKLDEDPYNSEYWLFLAETQYRQGQYTKALESCEFAKVADDGIQEFSSDIHYIRGICFEALGFKDKAFDEYKQSAYYGRYYK